MLQHLLTLLGPSLSYVAIGGLVPPAWAAMRRAAAWLLYYCCIPLVVFRATYIADVGAILTIAACSFSISCLAAGLSLLLPGGHGMRTARMVIFGYFNIGWFGIPIADVIYGSSGAIIMTAAYMGGVVFGATFGIYLITATMYRPVQSLLQVARTPAVHAMLLAAVLKQAEVRLQLHPALFGTAQTLLSFLGMALIGAAARRYGVALKEFGSLCRLLLQRLAVSMVAVALVLVGGWQLGLLYGEQLRVLSLIALFPVASNIVVIAEALDTRSEIFVAALTGSTLLAFPLVGAYALAMGHF